MLRILLLLIGVSLINGCASIEAKDEIKAGAVVDANHLPQTVVLVPPEVEIYSLDIGGNTEARAPALAPAEAGLSEGFGLYLKDHESLSQVELPALSDQERLLLERQVELFAQTATTAFNILNTKSRAWRHKRRHFDYSIGPGLAFLAKRSGAEVGVFLVASDQQSTDARIAASVFLGLLGGNVQQGESRINAGVVELKTGDILWLRQTIGRGFIDLSQPGDSYDLIESLFQDYGNEGGLF